MSTLTITGKTALLMHNVQLGDPENEYVRQIAQLNALKQKITDEQRRERDWLKFRGGLYYHEDDGPILPAANIFASLIKAGTITRNGTDVERAVVITTEYSPVDYDGPREPEAMFGLHTEKAGKTRFVDRRMAKINRAPVVAIRPRFDAWRATFEYELDEEVLNPRDFALIAEKAGRMIHVGDYRRFFGVYKAAITP